MNKYFLFGLVALCVASASAARIPRSDATESPLGQMFAGFEDTFNKLHTSFLDLVGVKSNSELFSMVETQSKTYVEKLQTIAGDLAEEAKKNSGPVTKSFEEIKGKINDAIKELETKNPELMADGKKYQEQFETQLRGLITDTEALQNKVKTESGPAFDKLKELTSQLYQTTVTAASSYTKEVEKTLKESKN